MSELKTKFSVGDAVFHATTTMVKKRHPCPDCLGSRKWQAASPAGGKYEFSCPRCSASYQSSDALCLEYHEHGPSVGPLTIGSVRVDTNDEHPVSYMCRETGVGSGSVYREESLFATREEAERAAAILAQTRNLTTPWIAKQYDKTLSLSDYQLESALAKQARDDRSRYTAELQFLFGDLRDCQTIEDVKKTIEDFSGRDAA